MGFGFVEVGAVTPRPQPGNPQPRVFRLARDKAVINRYGFNNDGLDAIEARLARRKAWPGGIVGVNLGANKDSEDRAADYVTCASRLHPHADFLTVNVSSPNTPGLRALQGAASLSGLLASVRKAAAGTRIFLKVAPDLTDEDKADIVDAATGAGIDALIVSNTTVGRERLVHDPGEACGLSGAPLYALSTEVLRDFAQALGGRLPLIGVGGIFGPDDAYGKILAGASLVQLYTGLVYHGPELVTDILSGLSERLAADGFANVADAVGADRQAGSGGGTSVSTGGSAT
jgi:dihydroorotate dehydrogenase